MAGDDLGKEIGELIIMNLIEAVEIGNAREILEESKGRVSAKFGIAMMLESGGKRGILGKRTIGMEFDRKRTLDRLKNASK